MSSSWCVCELCQQKQASDSSIKIKWIHWKLLQVIYFKQLVKVVTYLSNCCDHLNCCNMMAMRWWYYKWTLFFSTESFIQLVSPSVLMHLCWSVNVTPWYLRGVIYLNISSDLVAVALLTYIIIACHCVYRLHTFIQKATNS